MSTNRCLLNPTVALSQPVADAQAGAIIAIGNYLEGAPTDPKGGVPVVVLRLVPENGPFTVLGNIVGGPIVIDGAALGGPWQPLNVIGT